MKRPKLQSPENHDRWLVSYADFITLLFAFFVVLFASTKTDKDHAKAVSQSIQKALANGGISPEVAFFMSGTDKHKGVHAPDPPPLTCTPDALPGHLDCQKPEDLSHSLQLLKASLKQELDSGTVRLSLEQRGLIIELEAGAFFPSGEDAVNVNAYSTIYNLAKVLNGVPNALRLEGHTDSQPIRNSHFQSNWELSAARSIAMLRLLQTRFDVNPKRMAIVGYGDTTATGNDDTEENRSRNRRVDIVILNEQGMKAEPAQTAKKVLLPESEPKPMTPGLPRNKP